MEELDTIGKRLRFLRVSAGYSQEMLAPLIYVGSRGCISSYENDVRQISVDTLVEYSEVFQVTTDWITKGIDKDASEIEKIYYDLGSAKLQKIALEQMGSLSKLYL